MVRCTDGQTDGCQTYQSNTTVGFMKPSQNGCTIKLQENKTNAMLVLTGKGLYNIWHIAQIGSK